MTQRVCAALAALCLLAAIPFSPASEAQDSRDPAARADNSTVETPGVCEGDCPVLTLEELRRQVVRSSPEARSLRLEGRRAEAQLQDARGAFTPRLVSEYTYKTQDDKAKLDVLKAGMRLPLNLPMSPSLTADYRRGRGSSIDPSVSTSRDGETSVGVTVSPLRGFALGKEQAALRKARLETGRADALQARERNRLLLNATLAYWDWIEAVQKLEVARNLLELATRRRALVTRRAASGEAAAIDSTEAKLAVASRRDKVAAAVQKAEQAAVKLSTYLWTDEGAPQAFDFAAPDSLPRPQLSGASLQEAEQTALAQRPRLQALDAKYEQARVQQRLARGNLRPDFKLKTQLVSYRDGPLDVSDVKVGFEIDQPLFFREARSEARRARLDVRDVELKQQITRRKVRADAEAAVAALRQTRRRVEAAEERVALARRLQEAEQRRFNLGESTLFVLNQREQSLAEARKSLVSARVEVLRAVATYRWATGTIAGDLQAPGGT